MVYKPRVSAPQDDPPKLPPLPWPLRWAFATLAVVSLVLGIVGIFLPGLPTTVFILIAAWAAARSSPRLHAWLLRHKLFGPMIVNWRNGGCVSRRAKWSATAAMAVCIAILFLVRPNAWAPELGTTVMLVVLAWLWCRPEPQQQPPPAG